MSFLTFKPSPELTEVILERLICPNYSLANIAADHDTTLSALTLWLSRPEIQERIICNDLIAAQRARSAAIHQMHNVVNALATMVCAYNADERKLPLSNDNEGADRRDKLRNGARKASWLLNRITRFNPIIALHVPAPASPSPKVTTTISTAAHPAPDHADANFLSPSASPAPLREASSPSLTPLPTPNPHLNPDPNPPSDSNLPTPQSELSNPESAPPSALSAPLREASSPAPAPPQPSDLDPQPFLSASAYLNARTMFDQPVTIPNCNTLAGTLDLARALDPAFPFVDPWQPSNHYREVFEKHRRESPGPEPHPDEPPQLNSS